MARLLHIERYVTTVYHWTRLDSHSASRRGGQMPPDRTDKQIEGIVKELRDSVGLDFALPAFWFHILLEKLHEILPNFRIKLVSEFDFPIVEGFADCQTNEISIRDNVYNAALRGFGRERMTLAHEIGHLILK